tara:strand:+ start:322 stop:606 length:285 start_codon:yes stop_codon:yes gene_type:complete
MITEQDVINDNLAIYLEPVFKEEWKRIVNEIAHEHEVDLKTVEKLFYAYLTGELLGSGSLKKIDGSLYDTGLDRGPYYTQIVSKQTDKAKENVK